MAKQQTPPIISVSDLQEITKNARLFQQAPPQTSGLPTTGQPVQNQVIDPITALNQELNKALGIVPQMEIQQPQPELSAGEFYGQAGTMLKSGVGSLASRAGGALKLFGGENVGQSLQDWGDSVQDANQYVSALQDFSWDKLGTAEGWANMPRYAFEGFLTSAPEMLATLPIGGVGGKIATSLGAKLLPKVAAKLATYGAKGTTASKIAKTYLSKEGAQGLVQSATIGAFEGGDVYNSLIEQGVDPEKASDVAMDVLIDNMALTLINAPQYKNLFAPKAIQKASDKMAKYSGIVGTMALQGTGEGIEEVSQLAISKKAEDKALGVKDQGVLSRLTDPEFLSDDETAQSFVGGFGAGAGIGGATRAGQNVIQRIKGNPDNVQLQPEPESPDNGGNPSVPQPQDPSNGGNGGGQYTLADGTPITINGYSADGKIVSVKTAEGDIRNVDQSELIQVEAPQPEPVEQEGQPEQQTPQPIRTVTVGDAEIPVYKDDNTGEFVFDIGNVKQKEAQKTANELSERFPRMKFTLRDMNENSTDPFAEAEWELSAVPINSLEGERGEPATQTDPNTIDDKADGNVIGGGNPQPLPQQETITAPHAKKGESDANLGTLPTSQQDNTTPRSDSPTVSEMQGRTVRWNGQRGTLSIEEDGTAVLTPKRGTPYEIGKNISDQTIEQAGINTVRQSADATGEGTYKIVDENNEYDFKFEGFNYDENDAVVSVTGTKADGSKVTVRQSKIVDDILWNEFANNFEKISPEQQSAIEQELDQEVSNLAGKADAVPQSRVWLNANISEKTADIIDAVLSSKSLPDEWIDESIDELIDFIGSAESFELAGMENITEQDLPEVENAVSLAESIIDVLYEYKSNPTPDETSTENSEAEQPESQPEDEPLEGETPKPTTEEENGNPPKDEVVPSKIEELANRFDEVAGNKPVKPKPEDDAPEGALIKHVPNPPPPEPTSLKVGDYNKSFQEKLKAEGAEDTIVLANGEKRNGKYMVVELDDILASHDERSFTKTKGFPTLPDGTTPNDNDYQRNENAQAEVVRIAQEFDSDRVIQDTPVITRDGIVISGNNRTMSMKRVKSQNTHEWGEYKKKIREKAERFGLKPGDVDAFNNPVLVRMDETVDSYTTDEFHKYNVSANKTKSPLEMAVVASKRIDRKVAQDLFKYFDPEVHNTVRKALDDTAVSKAIAEALVRNGMVERNQLPSYYDTARGTFNSNGRLFVELLARATVLDEEALRYSEQEGVRQFAQSIEASLPILLKLKGGEFDVSTLISKAIRLKKMQVDQGLNNEELYSQQSMFSETEADFDSGLWHMVMGKGSNTFKEVIKSYYGQTENGGGLFGDGEPITRESVLNDILELLEAKYKDAKYQDEQKQLKRIKALDNVEPSPQGIGGQGGSNPAGLEGAENLDEKPSPSAENQADQGKPNSQGLSETELKKRAVERIENPDSYKLRNPEKNQLVKVNIDELLKRHQKDSPSYSLLNGNEIGSRIQDATVWLLDPKNADRELEPSLVYISYGKLGFEDGRHRLMAAKQLGATSVWIETAKGMDIFERPTKNVDNKAPTEGLPYEMIEIEGELYPIIKKGDVFEYKGEKYKAVSTNDPKENGYNNDFLIKLNARTFRAIPEGKAGDVLVTLVHNEKLVLLERNEKKTASDVIKNPPSPQMEKLNEEEEQIKKNLANLGKKFDNRSRGQANMGIDPELIKIQAEIVAELAKLGIVKFKKIVQYMKDIMGDDWLKRNWDNFKASFVANQILNGNPHNEDFNAIAKTTIDEALKFSDNNTEDNDVSDSPTNSTTDSQSDPTGKPTNDSLVSDGRGTSGKPRSASSVLNGSGSGTNSSTSSSSNTPAIDGKQGDTDLFGNPKQPKTPKSPSGRSNTGGRSSTDSKGDDAGLQPNDSHEAGAQEVSGDFGKLIAENRIKQKEAEKITSIDMMDESSIDETLPFLLPDQRKDVLLAETRFFSPDNDKFEKQYGKGVMFTNGTGTGKTYTGLGIIKRFWRAGKRNILIVVPSQAKVKDWSVDGQNLYLDINALEDTNDAGSGINVTTYANFRQNEALRSRNFDLVVYDESHRIMSAQDGNETSAYQQHRYITNAPGKESLQKAEENVTGIKYLSLQEAMTERLRELRKKENKTLQDLTPDQQKKLREDSIDDMYKRRQEIEQAVKGREKEVEAEQLRLVQSTKAVFLSATPFSYVNSLEYANGYLFDIDSQMGYKKEEGSQAYNEADKREAFYITNFGYRMRYNKLTRPESGVDENLMQRQFHEKLRKEGVLSRRKLENKSDYGRYFYTVEDAVGTKIDEVFSQLYEQKYRKLEELIRKERTFTYHKKMGILESLKIRAVIPRIKEHLALGRKVVLFHNFQTITPENPFQPIIDMSEETSTYGMDSEMAELVALSRDFVTENPIIHEIDLRGLTVPTQMIAEAFGEQVGYFSGRVSKKAKNEAKRRFNLDADNEESLNIIMVQTESGKEGISLHDTNGKHQRVLIDVGLPVRPTDQTQIEGRIYRLGTISNAIIEYPSVQLNFEKYAFIEGGRKGQLVENLALGNEARGIQDAFSLGYQNSEDVEFLPPNEVDGTGGKDADSNLEEIDEFDRAKTFFYGKQKITNKRRDQRDGADYFATPEPLGYKMVEWLFAKPNESLLEPSAGHGAISRFFPERTNNKAVEPSLKLYNEMMMNMNGDGIHDSFEAFNIINKFNGIAMNPPYGAGGKTAMEHVIKATKHLKLGGRVIAIVPNGPAMQKRIDNWLQSDESKGFQLTGEIVLPSVTFGRAGTSVNTKIMVIDRFDDPKFVKKMPSRFNRRIEAENFDELFDAIRDMRIPERVEFVEDIQEAIDPSNEVSVGNEYFNTKDQYHAKRGVDILNVALNQRIETYDFNRLKRLAGNHNGYWSNYKTKDTRPGFIFEKAEDANNFIKEASKYLNDEGIEAGGNPDPDDTPNPNVRLKKKASEIIDNPSPKRRASDFLSKVESEGLRIAKKLKALHEEHMSIDRTASQGKAFDEVRFWDSLREIMDTRKQLADVIKAKADDVIPFPTSYGYVVLAPSARKDVKYQINIFHNHNGELVPTADSRHNSIESVLRHLKDDLRDNELAEGIIRLFENPIRFKKDGTPESISDFNKKRTKEITNFLREKVRKFPLFTQDLIYIPERIEELPERIQREYYKNEEPAGMFYDGDIYVFPWKHPNNTQALRTLQHELVGHRGFQAMMSNLARGDRDQMQMMYDELADQIWESFANDPIFQNIKEQYSDKRFNEKWNRRVVAEEFIAYLAETDPDNTIIDKVVNWFLKLMRKLGLHVKMKKSEVISIIADARRFIEGGVIAMDNRLKPFVPESMNRMKMNQDGPRFYSNTERALDSIKQNKGTAEQFKAMLLKNGASQAEMDWMGWDDFFKDGDKVTKEQIQNWIDSNKIVLDEEVKSDRDYLKLLPEGWTVSEFPDGANVYNEEGEHMGEGNSVANALADAGFRYKPNTTTKYKDYALPDGQSYRELLLLMPSKNIIPDGWKVDFDKKRGNYLVYDSEGILQSSSTDKQDAINRSYHDKKYKSSHWNEPNVLAHIRFDERKGPNGEKVLFVNEIQSDWAQDGRKKGFNVPTEIDKKINVLKSKYGITYNSQTEFFEKDGLKVIPIEEENEYTLFNEVDSYKKTITSPSLEASSLIREIRDSDYVHGKRESSIPDMPFKNTPQWTKLALRRIIQYAVQNGYDSISFINGKQSAKLMGVSGSVNSIYRDVVYEKDSTIHIRMNSGNLLLRVQNETGKVLQTTGYAINDQFKGKLLKDIIGKELSEKVLALKTGEEISGEGLEVGGEGIKAFYDRLIPAELKAVVKKLDKNAPISQQKINDSNQLTLPITDTIRSKVQNEGMPMFRKQIQDLTNEHRTFKERAYRYVVDRYYDLDRVQKEVEQKWDKKLSDEQNALQDEALHHGRIRNELDNFNAKYKEKFAKISADLSKKYGLEYADIVDYLYALHAPERNNMIQYKRNRIQNDIDTNLALLADEGIAQDKFLSKALERRVAELTEKLQALEGKGAGMTNEEAEEILKELYSAGPDAERMLSQLADISKQINTYAREKAVEYGLMSSRRKEQLDKMFKHYMPLKGFDENPDDETVRVELDKKMTGRRSKAGDIVAYMFQQTEQVIVRGEKNSVLQHFARLVMAHPDPSAWEIENSYYQVVLDADGKPQYDQDGKVRWEQTFEKPDKKMFKEGLASHEAPDSNTNTINHGGYQKAKMENNKILVMMGGRPFIVKVADNNIARALKGTNVDKMWRWVSVVRQYTNWLRNMIIQYSPEFAPTNFFRDGFAGTFNLTAEFDAGTAMQVMKNTGKAMRAMQKAIRKNDYSGEYGKSFKEFQEEGGLTGYYELNDIAVRTKEVQKLIELAKNETTGAKVENAWNAFKTFIEDYNSIAENAIRLSTYHHLKTEKGFTRKKSAEFAKGLTVNFNRKGEIGSGFNSLFLFFNASVQGTDRILKNFTGSKRTKQRMIKLASALTMSGFAWPMIVRSLLGDDEDEESYYDKISAHTRHHNIIIPAFWTDEEGDYTKIPIAYGFNAFYAMGDVIGRMLLGYQGLGASALEISSVVMDSFNPLGADNASTVGKRLAKTMSPTITKPIIDIAVNENFMGMPVYDEPFPWETPEPASRRALPTTGIAARSVAKAVSNLTGGDGVSEGAIELSPDIIEHIYRTMTGGFGRFVEGVVNTTASLATGEEANVYNVPFLRRFYSKQSKSYNYRAFRDNLKSLEADYNRFETYVEQNEIEKAEQVLRENPDLIELYSMARSLSKDLYQIRKAKDVLKNESPSDYKDVVDIEQKSLKQFNRQANQKRKASAILN